MSKFKEYFSDPQLFTDGTYVISGELSQKDAAAAVSAEIGEPVTTHQMKADSVRFGFAPEYVESREDFDGPIWYTGAGNGKGTKAVWVYDPRG